MTKTIPALALLAMTFGAACGSSGSEGASDGGGHGDDTSMSASGSSSGGDDATGGGSSGSSSSGGASSSGGSDAGGSGSSGSSGASSGADASSAYDYSVYQHHKNGTRNGLYIEPTFTKTAVTTMHKTTFMGTVTTKVLAQPLYVENGPGGAPVLVMGTEQNHLTALNATTGAVVWDVGPTTIGQPVTGGLACAGDITPLGITGTPFIDASGGEAVVYFDAMTTPDGNTTAKHLVYAVKLADGTPISGWPVDVDAKVTGFTSHTQNQRGALQLVNGVLYVPYGGIDGDCGTYYGWVVGIPVGTPQSPKAWHTEAVRGGIWAPGSLPTDGTSVFPVTGNTSASGTTWGGGEAILRLGPSLTLPTATADYFATYNWKALDGTDSDLGGGSDVLFDMPGAAFPHLIAQGGKDGHFYLLNRDNLGGIGPVAGPGTELFSAHLASAQFKGAPAAYTTSMGTYVALYTTGTGTTCPNGGTGNLVVVKVTAGSPPTAAVAWCSSKSGLGSPMVTTTDGTANAVVWDANNTLWGFDGDTGAIVAGGANTALPASLQAFNTPIAAHGKIVVGVDGALAVFTP
jgi:hypothetical protein